MRILVVHSRYLSGAVSGENRVVDDEVAALRDGGHDVTLLARSPEVDGGVVRLVRTGVRSVWSREAAREVERTVRRERIEVVHCHNLFPTFSPSVLDAARCAGAAVVLTLHNYRLLCLPATFWRDGHTCEECLGRVPWRGVRYRCYRGSLPGSAALAGSVTLGRVRGTFRNATFLVAVSDFVREKYLQAGFPAERIVVKPNFVPPAPVREGPGDYFLYLGRLAPEKDVRLLIEAWRPSFGRLVIAGDGPDEARLRAHPAAAGVEFIGAVPPDRVPPLLLRARALVFPSRSFEGMPRAVLEAYAVGVPVLASDVGALPAVVPDGRSGLLVGTRSEDWADAMSRLGDDGVASELGRRAWQRWHALYSPEQGLAGLVELYERAVARNARGTA
jgi:glycosyltransferase involved in cell wall biosynthesis